MWSLAHHPVDGLYEILMADPPWSYKDKGIQGNAQDEYPTMGLSDLCQMPVGRLGAADSVLFMWATWPTLPDAFALGAAWGYKYKNCGFQWIKTNRKNAEPFIGLGHWTRGNSEPCLLFTRGKPHRVDAAVRQIVESDLICSPLTRHSRKPPEVRDRIIKLMGDRPALELFAREKALGWDQFGNEMPRETSVQWHPEEHT